MLFSLAPRLASTSARAAAPRRARRTGSLISDRKASSSSRSPATCTPAPLATKACGDLGEVLHVRPEHDRLAEHRRLEDVVAARGDEAAADEHDGGHLVEVASSPMVSSTTTSARGSASMARSDRRATFQPSARPARPPRRTARDCAARAGAARWARRPHAAERPQHRGLLALHRAAGHDHRARRRHAEVAQHAVARPRPAARRPARRASRTSGCRSPPRAPDRRRGR